MFRVSKSSPGGTRGHPRQGQQGTTRRVGLFQHGLRGPEGRLPGRARPWSGLRRLDQGAQTPRTVVYVHYLLRVHTVGEHAFYNIYQLRIFIFHFVFLRDKIWSSIRRSQVRSSMQSIKCMAWSKQMWNAHPSVYHRKRTKKQNKARSARVGRGLDHKHQVPGGLEVAGLAGGGRGWGGVTGCSLPCRMIPVFSFGSAGSRRLFQAAAFAVVKLWNPCTPAYVVLVLTRYSFSFPTTSLHGHVMLYESRAIYLFLHVPLPCGQNVVHVFFFRTSPGWTTTALPRS